MIDHGAEVAAKLGIARSGEWSHVEKLHLLKQPHCVACARPRGRVEVHHIFPFHLCVRLGRPDLELDPRNLVTLCAESSSAGAGDHHLLLGHFDDYESMNLGVRREAAHDFHGWLARRIRADLRWQQLAALKPPHLAQLDARDKREMRRAMDMTMPRRE